VKTNQITIIIVSYKSGEILLKCLKNFESFKKIFILDNSNDKKLKNKVLKIYPHIKFYLSDKNLGYSKSNNFLLNLVKTKYSLLINPDTTIKLNNIIKLIKAAKLLKDKFNILTPYNKKFHPSNYYTKKFVNTFKNKIYNNIYEIDLVNFYAPLINMNKKKLLRTLDTNFFMYYEDWDLCKRIRESGGKIYLVLNSLAQHKSGKSSKSKGYNSKRYFHWGWSFVYYHKKHFNIFPAYFNILMLKFKLYLKIIIFKFAQKKLSDITNMKCILNGINRGLNERKDFSREKY
jgi:N-acetylglucosaminyl-diphospho-decaprenol L-rhamnosyltransferase